MQILRESIIDETGGILQMLRDKRRYYIVLRNKDTGYDDTMFGTKSIRLADKVFQQITNVNL